MANLMLSGSQNNSSYPIQGGGEFDRICANRANSSPYHYLDDKRMQLELLSLQIPNVLTWQKDLKSVYTGLNSACAKVFGLHKPEQATGLRDEMFPCKMSELAQKFQSDDQKVMDTGKSRTLIEIIQCTKNNDWKVFQTTKNPLFDERRRIIGTFGLCIDITTSLTRFKPIPSKSQQSFVLDYGYENLALSPKQSECFFYLLRGMTSKQIAHILNISFRTVETHIDAIKNKMGCHKKSELIDKAFSLGLQNIIPKNIFKQQLSLE